MKELTMRRFVPASLLATLFFAAPVWADPISFQTFSFAGPDAASVTPTRDAFRAAIGGGTVAGANGSFGGLRREINWDGVPAAFDNPNALPPNFFNSNSPRGVVFSTLGTGFLVSANGVATPPLFGFPTDYQAFSSPRLFTAVNSNITDVSFFLPGTATPATTTAFGVIFTDVEVPDLTKIEFFDQANLSIFSAFAPVAGNQGLSFLGAIETGGAISRVRITSGLNIIVSNGVRPNETDDAVVMDDFLYAEPRLAAVPEPGSLLLLGGGLAAFVVRRRVLR